MSIALSHDQLQFIYSTVVTPLNKLGAEVYVFGSRATGNHSAFSDLDLLIRSTTNSEELKSILSIINDRLIDSLFPYKVDLVLEQDLAPSYKNTILHQAIKLFTA